MKKPFAACMALFLVLGCGLTATAAASPIDSGYKVYDYASLFTDQEEVTLNESASTMAGLYQTDVVIVTTADTKGKSTAAYADDFFDENGFGYGPTYDGLIFVIDMGNREMFLSTSGAAMNYFSDDAADAILDRAYEYLAGDNEDFYSACLSVLTDVQAVFSQKAPAPATTAPPVPKPRKPFNWAGLGKSLLGGAFVAIIVGVILVFAHSRSLSPTPGAQVYMGDTFRPVGQRDVFLHTHTTRVRLSQNHGSGGGGGSSGVSRSGGGSHSSSSGRSHGGRGRSFASGGNPFEKRVDPKADFIGGKSAPI